MSIDLKTKADAHLKAVAEDNLIQKRLIERTTTISMDVLNKRPEAREMIAGRFPAKATSALVAMGGIGKTTWSGLVSILQAIAGVESIFITAEDGPEDYQSKIHNALFTPDIHNNQVEGINHAEVAGKIHVLNLRGSGSKLIVEDGGSFIPSKLTNDLADYLADSLPKVRLVFFETVSRFAGGEDNDRMEAIVTACDHIASAINGACVLVHHTGKGQARDKVVDLYTGRGGSALGDNTRSMTVLTRIDDDYAGLLPIVASHEDVEAKRVFEVLHVRSSYSATVEPEYYVTRRGYCHGPVLERLKIATSEDVMKSKLERIDAKDNAAASKIHDAIKAKGGKVGRKYFDLETKDKIGVTQSRAREIIAEMLSAGSLVESEEQAGRAKKKYLTIGQWN